MNVIKFSHNWNNKLDCEIFTTIRRYTEEKYIYYRENTFREFKVELKGKPKNNSELIAVERHPLIKIPMLILKLDTGIFNDTKVLELFKRFGINKKDMAILLIFKRKNK
jgi:hypothetical protein